MDFKDKSVLVWDNGLFPHCAIMFSQHFGKTLYGGAYVNAFPKSNSTLPGDGIDGVTRILDFWKHARTVDLIVFPDVGYADMQVECDRQGMRVYGSRYGELMELDRWGFKKLLIKLNMPVAESHLIHGVEQLRDFLKEHDRKWWIKTSRYRGDFETVSCDNYDLFKPWIDEREFLMGRKALIYPFIVEKDIPAILEVGYDGDSVDGQFPGDEDLSIFGIERKDLDYVGIAKKYKLLPEPVRWANKMLSDRMREYKYRGFFSSEIRCQEESEVDPTPPKQWRDAPMLWNLGQPVPGTTLYAWVTDPCCRMASPPSECYIDWITNWPEKIWKGAEGIYVPHEVDAKYGLEAMMHSALADRSWLPIHFPEEVRPFVKLRNHCRIEGVDSAVPQAVGLPEIGAVTARSDILIEAIEQLHEHASKVTGLQLEVKTDAISPTLCDIEKAQELGLEFTDDPLPSAEELEALETANA